MELALLPCVCSGVEFNETEPVIWDGEKRKEFHTASMFCGPHLNHWKQYLWIEHTLIWWRDPLKIWNKQQKNDPNASPSVAELIHVLPKPVHEIPLFQLHVHSQTACHATGIFSIWMSSFSVQETPFQTSHSKNNGSVQSHFMKAS